MRYYKNSLEKIAEREAFGVISNAAESGRCAAYGVTSSGRVLIAPIEAGSISSRFFGQENELLGGQEESAEALELADAIRQSIPAGEYAGMLFGDDSKEFAEEIGALPSGEEEEAAAHQLDDQLEGLHSEIFRVLFGISASWPADSHRMGVNPLPALRRLRGNRFVRPEDGRTVRFAEQIGEEFIINVGGLELRLPTT